MQWAAFFSGQGAQSVGMQRALSDAFPIVRETYQECSDAISIDLRTLAQAGPEADLGRTENTQPALLAAGVAAYRAWLAQGGAPANIFAGHSLGEYSALVCAGSLNLHDAARLVRLRGTLMQAAVPEGVGAMAAVLNADLDAIESACVDAAQGEVIAPANLNAPGQIVISGHASALDRTLALLAERGVRKAIRLPVSVPSHCALMRPAADQLAAAIALTEISMPRQTVLHNVSAAAALDLDGLRGALIAQLYSRVRWIETVQACAALGVQKGIECGPGKALSGMVKRIAPELLMGTSNTPEELAAANA